MPPQFFEGWHGVALRTPRLGDIAIELAERLDPEGCLAAGEQLIEIAKSAKNPRAPFEDAFDPSQLPGPAEREVIQKEAVQSKRSLFRDLTTFRTEVEAAAEARGIDVKPDRYYGFSRRAKPTYIEINPFATKKELLAEFEERLHDLQDQLGKQKQFFRDRAIEDQLAVWDLREGWTGSGYDLSRRQSFSEVAATLGCGSSTVNDRYHAAFSLITGQEYSPDMWWRAFAQFRSLLIADSAERQEYQTEAEKISGRSNRSVKAASFGILNENAGEPPGAEKLGSARANTFEADWEARRGEETISLIREMINRGYSDAAIASDLSSRGESVANKDDIAEFRAADKDG